MSTHENENQGNQEVEQKSTFGNKFILPLILIAVLFVVLYYIGNGSGHEGGHHAEGHGDGHNSEAVHHDGDDHHDHEHDHDHNHDGHHDHGHEGDHDSHSDHEDHDSKYSDELDFDEDSWAWLINEFLAKGEGNSSFTLNKIPFEGDELDIEGKEQLDQLAAILKAYPDANVTIKGHSRSGDNVAEKTTNKTVTNGRAFFVKERLKSRGVPGSQMKIKGMGGAEPLDGVDPKDMSQRRITIQFDSSN